MIGSAITRELLERGHTVAHLGRSARSGAVPSFRWDLKSGEIDDRAFKGVHAVIHLAGASISKRWTSAYKREIVNSRVESSALLDQALKAHPEIQRVICASASGIYPSDDERLWREDESIPADAGGFLASTTAQWEAATAPLGAGRQRVVFRIGLVMSGDGGALPVMAAPVRWVGAAPMGSGRQWMPWIHIDDLVGLFVEAVEKEAYQGVYNAAAPNPVRHTEFMKTLARILHRWYIPIRIPGFLLRWVMGEQAALVLEGAQLSADKVLRTGYTFKFPKLADALKNLLA